jgi:hypothetical protein
MPRSGLRVRVVDLEVDERAELPWIYAALIHTYPRRWRRGGRDDELLAVLLDSAATAGRRTPDVSECLDVAAHGLAERLRPVSVIFSAPTRARLAQLALIVGTALSLFFMLGGELRVPGFSDGMSPNHLDEWLRHGWGPFQTVGVLIYLSWFVVAVSYLFGDTRRTRELSLFALAITLFLPTIARLSDVQRPPGGVLAGLASLAVGVALLPSRWVITSRQRLASSAAVLALVGALIVWRYQGLDRAAPYPREWLKSRAMFYWNPNATHMQVNRDLARDGRWLVLLLVLGALVAWNIDRSWLPAAAYLLIPLSLLRLGTASFESPDAQLDALIWTCAVFGVLVANWLVARWLIEGRRERLDENPRATRTR